MYYKERIFMEYFISRKPKKHIDALYKIDELLKLKVANDLIMFDGSQRNYLKIKVKEIRYSKTLKQNIYTIIVLDTAGEIEDIVDENWLKENTL
jgi:hypothetical protein